MQKQKHILEGLIILNIIFIFGLLSIKFIYRIRHEHIDTSYMWDISLDNFSETKESENGQYFIDNNIINLDVLLKKEEDFYELTFDIVNKGTLNAKLDNIETKLENKENILKWQIAYVDGDKLEEGDIIPSNNNKKVKIYVYYPKQTKKVYEALELKLSLLLEYKATYDSWQTNIKKE